MTVICIKGQEVSPGYRVNQFLSSFVCNICYQHLLRFEGPTCPYMLLQQPVALRMTQKLKKNGNILHEVLPASCHWGIRCEGAGLNVYFSHKLSLVQVTLQTPCGTAEVVAIARKITSPAMIMFWFRFGDFVIWLFWAKSIVAWSFSAAIIAL